MPGYAPTQEVRLAVCMFGGVSLAVYINGVAQELLNLVRASAPKLGSDEPLLDDPQGTEKIYRRLSQLVGCTDDRSDADTPIRTRFVVDMVSGASAGGINGIFLAKALARDQKIDQLKQVWFRDADIGGLLNDDLPPDVPKYLLLSPPPSLLNGEVMSHKLLRALNDMDTTTTEGPSPLVDELDLFVTATDLEGLTAKVKLADQVVSERVHRATWHLRYTPRSMPPRDDFTSDLNAAMAFVARSTSAFPFAFEPASYAHALEIAARNGDRETERLRTFREQLFESYLTEDREDNPEGRFFGDGGSLDNSPFTQLIDLLTDRRSTIPVDRKLIYIEPDPAHPELENAKKGVHEAPVALTNTLQQSLLLPRIQTIKEDLDRVTARNERAAVARELLETVHGFVRTVPVTAPAPNWVDRDEPESADPMAVYERMLHKLKVDTVAAALTMLVIRAAKLSTTSDYPKAIRAVLHAWIDTFSRREQKQLLVDFDFDYRLRRINFVQWIADAVYQLDDRAAAFLAVSGAGDRPDADGATQIRQRIVSIKDGLNVVFRRLVSARDSLADEGGPMAGGIAELQRLPFGEAYVDELLASIALDEGVAPQAAKDALSGSAGALVKTSLKQLYDRCAVQTATVFTDASNSIEALLPKEGDAAATCLRYFYDRYEAYDNAVLPLLRSFDGELDTVDVVRFSPWDATSIIDESKSGRKKLAGNKILHFGAFFSEAWRRNDLMWGRLDAAERILCMMLPEGDERSSLLRDAQLAIIGEEFQAQPNLPALVASELVARAGSDAGTPPAVSREEAADAVEEAVRAKKEPAELLAYLKSREYRGPKGLDPEDSAQLGGRAAGVMSEMMKGTADAPAVGLVARWLARLLKLISEFVRLALPGRARVLVRHWLKLLVLLEVLLIVGGAFIGRDAAKSLGWNLLALTLAAIVLTAAFRDVLRKAKWTRRIAIAVVVLVAVGVGWIVQRHWDEDVARPAKRICAPSGLRSVPWWCQRTDETSQQIGVK